MEQGSTWVIASTFSSSVWWSSRKAIDRLTDVHRAQLLSYLKLGGYRVGYLLNFNVKMLRDGICRLANGL
jgi:hypothetical protein